jgi:hypothetical protein
VADLPTQRLTLMHSTLNAILLILLCATPARAEIWWTAISDANGPAHCVPISGSVVEYALKYHTANSLTQPVPGGGTATLLQGGAFGEFGQWFFMDRKDCHTVMGG